MDIAVAYRVYPGISKSPAIYSHDKFRLSKACVQSFRRALGQLKAKIWLILDNCPPRYEAMFREVFDGYRCEILNVNRIGNPGTFALQIDLLVNQTDAEYVYFAEDDYFYFPNALERMITFMTTNRDAEFVTPYDHPDSYYSSSNLETHLVRPWGDRYWRTASSTCLTFMTSHNTLRKTSSMFKTYCAGNMDCSLWLSLTEKARLANPKIHFQSSLRAKIWAKTWLWGWRRILFGRRYRLWAPLPALATHIESTCLAPLIDWQQEFQKSQS